MVLLFLWEVEGFVVFDGFVLLFASCCAVFVCFGLLLGFCAGHGHCACVGAWLVWLLGWLDCLLCVGGCLLRHAVFHC